MRVDARRNRTAVLGAARELIAKDGASFTMEALAEQAQVAVGTLYRHFPTKAALVSAVLEETLVAVAEIVEDGERQVRAGAPAGAAMADAFRRIAQNYVSDAPVKYAAASLGVAVDLESLTQAAPAGGAAARAGSAITALLRMAQQRGQVRADVTMADLILVIGAMPGDASAEVRDRYLTIMLTGLGLTD